MWASQSVHQPTQDFGTTTVNWKSEIQIKEDYAGGEYKVFIKVAQNIISQTNQSRCVTGDWISFVFL